MFWEQDPDAYAYEEEQERRALMQGLHQPMKAWYNGDDATKIKERFGAFPMFWQDLLTWEHTRLVQKMYLKFVDTGAGATSLLEMIDEQQQQQAEQGPEAAPQEDGVVGDGVPAQNGEAGEVMDEAQQQQQQENGEDQSVASLATETTQSAEEEKERKKRSRWGEPQKKSRWGGTPTDTADGGEKKKTRWSQPAPGTVEAAQQAQAQQPMLTQEQIQEIIVLQLRMEGIAKKMLTVAQDALAKENDPDKTPSPPPVYDANGKRLNTREVRMGEALKKERNDVIEKLIKLNPLYRPPSDYVRPKPFRKLYIPQNEYPQYNFIGLIIGPRGNTQKRMERETNTKIAIRGKGSIKEGARGKDRHKHADDEHDELHVLVQGETEEEVEASAKMIADLLVPVEDDNNEHKQKQLRELALINGTLREEEYCNICGEKGHRQFECPHRHTKVKTVQVKCAICGDTSHPTRDCAQRKQPETAQHKEQLDQEYLNFMMELGEAPPPGMGPPASSSSFGPPSSGPPPATSHPSPSRPPPPTTSAPPPAPRPPAPQPYRPAPPTNPPPPRTSYPPRNTSYPPSSYGGPPPPSYPPSTSSYGPPPPPPPPPTSYPPAAYPGYYGSYPPTYSYPYPGYDYSSYGPPPPPPPNPGQSQHNGPSVPPPPPPPPQA